MATKQEFNSFEDMLASSDIPVLVDFYATWCGPCQIMAKILEQVNAQMSGQLKIVKIDTDKYEQLAVDNRVYALPTLVLFKKGQPVDRIEGVMQPADLIQRLQSFL